MHKVILSLATLSFVFAFGAAQAAKHEAPKAAAPAAKEEKKDPCAEVKKDGDMKKKSTDKKAEPAKK
jgi:hypothetical protein